MLPVTETDRGASLWVFGDALYRVELGKQDQDLTPDQVTLLIMESVDKERRKFERLARLHTPGDGASVREAGIRPRVPEQVRIAVWRRDGGKCARCGSRERLEYDHIVPVSRGGANTERNIELLCERCNREKGDRIG
jgi:5-methylcytosine-specific restriction endonuclease McrA